MKKTHTYNLDVDALSDFSLMVIMKWVVSFTAPIQPFLDVVKEVGVKRGLLTYEEDALCWTPKALKIWRQAAKQRADRQLERRQAEQFFVSSETVAAMGKKRKKKVEYTGVVADYARKFGKKAAREEFGDHYKG